ncbi:hypothetical protein GEMRC1_008901 [Eukaryota sp. GEM-RC1]
MPSLITSLLERRIQWVEETRKDAQMERLLSGSKHKVDRTATSTDGFLLPPKPLFPYERTSKWLSLPSPVRHSSGFNNIGNTCFLNATLQAILNLPPFYIYLRTCHGSCNKSGFCSICALKRLSLKAFSSNRPIVPTEITSHIRALRKSFRIGRQEDAHEFLLSLFGHFQDCITGGPKMERKMPPKVPYTTVLYQMIGCFLASSVECHNCHHVSRIFEPVLGLSLEINRKSKSIEGALDKFVSKEDVQSFKCDSCKTTTSVSKWFSIRTLPNVLLIHLKRFSFLGRGSKVCTPVQFPENLNLSKYLAFPEDGFQYTLHSLILHHGRSLSFGHYTSYVKSSNGLWYHYDDERVSQVSLQTVLSKTEAYIVIYVRVGEGNCSIDEELGDIQPLVSSHVVEKVPKQLPSVDFTLTCGKRKAFENKSNLKKSNGGSILKFDEDRPNRPLVISIKSKKSSAASYFSSAKAAETDLEQWGGGQELSVLRDQEAGRKIRNLNVISDYDRRLDVSESFKERKEKEICSIQRFEEFF